MVSAFTHCIVLQKKPATEESVNLTFFENFTIPITFGEHKKWKFSFLLGILCGEYDEKRGDDVILRVGSLEVVQAARHTYKISPVCLGEKKPLDAK